MLAYVYKSQKRADTYVFLADRDDFARLPESLRTQLGALTFVMELELTPDRKLARENAAEVMQNLGARGFHLQFPPSTAVDPLSEDWGTDA
ncbi:YcgL domain-containing protein [Solilutibacter tolerans]|nr:YcgL domain-containing protein [Lysobacter tolerans]